MITTAIHHEIKRLQIKLFNFLEEVQDFYGQEKAQKILNIFEEQELITKETSKSLLNKLIIRGINDTQVSGLLEKCCNLLDEVLEESKKDE